MVAGVGNFQPFAASRAPLVWNGYLLAASQVMAGNGLRAFLYLFGGATGDQCSAALSRPDSKVDDQIGFAHSLFVVLYDDNGIAYVAESLERLEQALVVAIVEADGGFVEHVHDANQSRTYLRGEADALGFAPREGMCAAI